MYILNEKDFIREVLVSKTKPNDISFPYLITLISKYYFYNCENYVELSNLVKEKLSEFYIPGYQEYFYHPKIESICKELFETRNIAFKEREYVPVYERDIEIINSLDSDRKKKIMFTFFAVARYMECDGWINKKTSGDLAEIFRLANVNMATNQRSKILHELYIDGYITLAKRIDNLNIHVDLGECDSGTVAYRISQFKNVGNQYLLSYKQGLRQCACCGRIIKITGNRKKYCARCAKIVQDEQKREWRRTANKVKSEGASEK